MSSLPWTGCSPPLFILRFLSPSCTIEANSRRTPRFNCRRSSQLPSPSLFFEPIERSVVLLRACLARGPFSLCKFLFFSLRRSSPRDRSPPSFFAVDRRRRVETIFSQAGAFNRPLFLLYGLLHSPPEESPRHRDPYLSACLLPSGN